MSLYRCKSCKRVYHDEDLVPAAWRCPACDRIDFGHVPNPPPAFGPARALHLARDEAPDIGDASEFDEPPPHPRPRFRLLLGGGEEGATLPPDPHPPRETP